MTERKRWEALFRTQVLSRMQQALKNVENIISLLNHQLKRPIGHDRYKIYRDLSTVVFERAAAMPIPGGDGWRACGSMADVHGELRAMLEAGTKGDFEQESVGVDGALTLVGVD